MSWNAAPKPVVVGRRNGKLERSRAEIYAAVERGEHVHIEATRGEVCVVGTCDGLPRFDLEVWYPPYPEPELPPHACEKADQYEVRLVGMALEFTTGKDRKWYRNRWTGLYCNEPNCRYQVACERHPHGFTEEQVRDEFGPIRDRILVEAR